MNDELCGRPTKAKRQCTNRRLRPIGVRVEGCQWHLTDDEKRRIQEMDDVMNKIRDEHFNADPACWSWPVPDVLEVPAHVSPFSVWQDRHCAICGYPDGSLVTDHDHLTGLIRGKLCISCNVQEGHSDAPIFAKYRKKNPATILGVEEVYRTPWDPDDIRYESLRNPASQEERKAAADRLRLPRPEDLGVTL